MVTRSAALIFDISFQDSKIDAPPDTDTPVFREQIYSSWNAMHPVSTRVAPCICPSSTLVWEMLGNSLGRLKLIFMPATFATSIWYYSFDLLSKQRKAQAHVKKHLTVKPEIP